MEVPSPDLHRDREVSMMSDPDEQLEAQRLRALLETGLLTSPSCPDLERLCQRAKERFGVAIAMVTLLDKDNLFVKANAGTDWETVPRAGQFCDHTIRSDAPFVVPDATQDPHFASNPVVTGDAHIRFYAGAPLIYRRDIRLGALCLLDIQPRAFSLSDRAQLDAMADEVVSVIMDHALDNLTRKPPHETIRGSQTLRQ